MYSIYKGKVTCILRYLVWMDEGHHTIYTEAGNMRGPPLEIGLRWVLDAWRGLNPDIIKSRLDVVHCLMLLMGWKMRK